MVSIWPWREKKLYHGYLSIDIPHNFAYTILAGILLKIRMTIMKEYMTIKEASEKWGIGTRWINTLCHEGRIEGVVMFGASFAIPRDAEKPEDKRIKSGKYIKKKDERQ